MAEVRQKIDLDVSGSVSGLEQLSRLIIGLDGKLRELGSSQKGAMSGAEEAARDFNKELSTQAQTFKKVESSVKGFEKELKDTKGLFTDLQKAQKQFVTDADYKKLQTEITGVKSRINELDNSFDNAGKASKKASVEGSSSFKEFGKTIAGAFAVGAVVAWAQQIGKAILDVTAEFQKFEAVLTTSLGSNSAAERAMSMISDFAAKTPFSVNELTDSYVKLASRGIRASAKEMEALGDLAASTGKSFEQLTEATLDAMSGENERLKEFGVTAKRTGETTQYTFKGVTTEVKNSDAAIRDYLISLGQVEGVTGSMAAISETLTGQMSNLGDSLDQLFLTIGNQETGAMSAFTSWLSDSITFMTELVSTTDQLGAKMASEGISTFAEDIEGKLTTIAASAKQSGQDVATALDEQTATLRSNLTKQLAEAQKAVDDFGHVTFFNRDEAAELKAQVALLTGELAALDDARRFVLEDLAKAENKATADAAEAGAKAAIAAAEKEKAARLKAKAELLKELQALEDQAAKARINMMDKNSEAYLQAVRAAELKQVAAIEESLRKQARIAGVSTELTPEQQEQLRLLALEVDKKYYDALYKLQQANEDKLLELQKDSDEKQLEQLTRKYEQQIRAAEEAGNAEIANALRVQQKVAEAQLKRQQAEKNLDTDEELAKAVAESIIPDNLDKVEAERMLQQQILDIDIEFAEKRLALVADSMDKEDRIKALQLQNEIDRLKKEKAALAEAENKFSLQKLLGLDDKQMDAVKEGAQMALNELASFLDQTVALRQQEVQSLTQAIEEKGRELDREIDLNKEGFASNVETKQAEYEELKAQRQKAMKDQQQAQRAQMALDTAVQASNLITSSTSIYKTLSPLGPLGIGIAVATIATMFGTFLAAKAKALQATKTPTFEKGGGFEIKGASHKEGGVDLIDNKSGKKLAEYEGHEYLFAINKKSTYKYTELLEAINKDNPTAIVKYALDELLTGTGVVFNPELPEKLQTLQIESRTVTNTTTHRQSEAQLKEMNSYLKQISQNSKPGPQRFENDKYITEQQGNKTRIIRKHV